MSIWMPSGFEKSPCLQMGAADRRALCSCEGAAAVADALKHDRRQSADGAIGVVSTSQKFAYRELEAFQQSLIWVHDEFSMHSIWQSEYPSLTRSGLTQLAAQSTRAGASTSKLAPPTGRATSGGLTSSPHA